MYENKKNSLMHLILIITTCCYEDVDFILGAMSVWKFLCYLCQGEIMRQKREKWIDRVIRQIVKTYSRKNINYTYNLTDFSDGNIWWWIWWRWGWCGAVCFIACRCWWRLNRMDIHIALFWVTIRKTKSLRPLRKAANHFCSCKIQI